MEPTNLHRIIMMEDVNGGPATEGRLTGSPVLGALGWTYDKDGCIGLRTDQRPLGMRTGLIYLDG